MFNIVLHEPEIPANTGNIGRLCVGHECRLHLIEPYAFEITDKQLKRAGLDYWDKLHWQTHKSLEDFLSHVEDPSRVFYFTTKVEQSYYEISFQAGDYLVFGKETKGLPEAVIEKNKVQAVTIPFSGQIRSFNLANAVSMAVSEGVRQLKFSGN